MAFKLKHLFTILILIIASTFPALALDKPKIILTFDDGWTSTYFKAFPKMQANGQQGTAFIITGEVAGASGQQGIEYMTLSQLQTLYTAGWDLSSHTVTHPYLTTTSNINTELSASQKWLNDSGFKRGTQFLAYPYGDYNTNVINALKANKYLAARTVNPAESTYPKYKLTDPAVFEMGTLLVAGVPGYGNPATSVADIKQEINKTVAANGLLILSFHFIVDACCTNNNVPEDFKTTDFYTISDFLKSQQDAGRLEVITMSQYFGASETPTPSPSPSPTPTPDITAPVITITTPAATTYTEGTTVLARFTCSDANLKSCNGTVPNRTKINVIGAGTKTFTVNASDVAGNMNSKNVVYTVVAVTPPPSPSPSPTPIPTKTPVIVKLTATEDTYTSTKLLATNYGSAKYLYGVSGNKIYLKYNTSVIPQNATVLSANMTLSVSWSAGAGTLNVYPVTSAWAEKTLKGNTVITTGNKFTTMTYPACSNDCWRTNVGFENTVRGWVNGSVANNGIVAYAASGKMVEFNSRETSYKPYLTVKYV